MLAQVVITLVTLLCAQAVATEIYLDESFETDSAAAVVRGIGELAQTDRGRVLRIQNTDAQGSRTVGFNLPAEKLRGKSVWMSADVKAADVSQKPQSWNGIKLMLVIQRPNRTDYPQPTMEVGSFDWRTVSSTCIVPDDAQSVRLTIGLERVTGDVWFDNVKVSLRKVLTRAPAATPDKQIYKGHDLPRLRGAMAGTTLTDADIEYFANNLNGNLLRWQLVQHGKTPPNNYDAWLAAELDKLDQALASCEKYRVMVVVDLHSPPGGTTVNGAYIGATGAIFSSPEAQATFLRAWQTIATRYKGRNIIWGFDLMNEPVETSLAQGCDDWQDLSLKAARAVHAVDPSRTIIVEPGPWGSASGFATFNPLDEPNIVYSFHMYEPHQFTHQGVHSPIEPAISYPGMIAGKQWDKTALEAAMQPAIDFAARYRVHMYVGEFSAIRWAPGAAQYLADVTDIFEKHGWDWTYHAYREWPGWSVEHVGGPNQTRRADNPTDRQEALAAWLRKNLKPTAGQTP